MLRSTVCTWYETIWSDNKAASGNMGAICIWACDMCASVCTVRVDGRRRRKAMALTVERRRAMMSGRVMDVGGCAAEGDRGR